MLEHYLFADYEPTYGGPNFQDRLTAWLDSAGTEADQQLLFQMLGDLYFAGQDEFSVLYRDAFDGPVMWWLTEVASIDLLANDAPERIETAVRETWFCPVTDSMQIARFHHVNRLEGHDLRPDWRTLAELGSVEKIRQHMRVNRLSHLVLLEDFIGTGTQALRAVGFAAELSAELDVLLVPLVITDRGYERVASVVAEHPRFAVQPVAVLPPSSVLSHGPQAGEDGARKLYRDLLRRLTPLINPPGRDADERAFGYGKLGALFVMHTNCPNNAPPAFHFDNSPTWSPLFPRSSRL